MGDAVGELAIDRKGDKMKSRCNGVKILCAPLLLMACGAALLTAHAQEPGAVGSRPTVPAGPGKSVCLENHLIDHTEIVDSSTILFHMIGGKTWKNTLTVPCTTLTHEDGFLYEPKVDRICSNIDHFHVLRTGEVCLLGEFTPYTAPVKQPISVMSR